MPYVIGAAFFALGVAIAHKPTLHQQLRSVHGTGGDAFFKFFTHLGEWYIVAIVLMIFLLLRRWKSVVSLGLAFGVASCITQALKHIIKAERPWFYFEALRGDTAIGFDANLWVVKGINLMDKTSPSFPSGHSTTAFVAFLSIAFFLGRGARNRTLTGILQFACLVAAALVAYSRVYLSFHFAEDVLVGSVIGVATVCVSIPLVEYVCERFNINCGKDLSFEHVEE